MTFTTYVILLAAGGLTIGVLLGALLPRASTGGMLAAIWVCVIFTVTGGIFITEFFGAEHTLGLPLALVLAPLYLVGTGRGGSGGLMPSWGGGDYGSGGSDCGGGGGGGDGGGSCS